MLTSPVRSTTASVLDRITKSVPRRSRRDEILQHVEAEQVRIASDLHDGVGPQLHALSYDLCSLRNEVLKTLGADHPTTLRLDAAVRHTGQIATTLRCLSRSLSPFEAGDSKTLEEALSLIPLVYAATEQCQVTVTTDGIGGPPPHEVARHLYAVAAEATANAFRHGYALNVDISVKRTENHEYQLTITDDGVGFDPAGCPPGVGIRSFRYRAGQIGGWATVTSELGKGTTVKITAPCDRSEVLVFIGPGARSTTVFKPTT